MPDNDLHDYMSQRTAEIQSEYERIRKRSREDPGTAGDNGEENWRAVFEEWLPPMYHVVTKGRIMNIKGQCGPQVDVLVLSPFYPKHLRDKKEYLEGGVIAAFECKLTLSASDIREAVQNSVDLRRGTSYPLRKGTPYKEANHPLIYGLLAHSHQWKRDGSAPLENIEKHLHENETSHVEHPRELLDVVCVADLAAWTTAKMFLPPQIFLDAQGKLDETYGGRYGNFPYQNGVLETVHVRHSKETQNKAGDRERVKPLGALLTFLLQRIAYEDAGLRALAEYFVLANISGSGQGNARLWQLSNVFSGELQAKMWRHPWNTGGRWDEWGASL